MTILLSSNTRRENLSLQQVLLKSFGIKFRILFILESKHFQEKCFIQKLQYIDLIKVLLK